MTLTGVEVVAASVLFVLIPVGTAVACLKLSRRPIRVHVTSPSTEEGVQEIVIPEVQGSGVAGRLSGALVRRPAAAARQRLAGRREREEIRRLNRRFHGVFDADERCDLEAAFRIAAAQPDLPAPARLRRLQRRQVPLAAVTLPSDASGAVLLFEDGSLVRIDTVEDVQVRRLQARAGRGEVVLRQVETDAGHDGGAQLRFQTGDGLLTLAAAQLHG